MSPECRNPLKCTVIHEVKSEVTDVNVKLTHLSSIVHSIFEVRFRSKYSNFCKVFTLIQNPKHSVIDEEISEVTAQLDDLCSTVHSILQVQKLNF